MKILAESANREKQVGEQRQKVYQIQEKRTQTHEVLCLHLQCKIISLFPKSFVKSSKCIHLTKCANIFLIYAAPMCSHF